MKKLTKDEAKKLEKFVDESGGQVQASLLLGVAPSTISRTINRHRAPMPLFRKELVQRGIIQP